MADYSFPVVTAYDQLIHDFFILFDTYTYFIVLHNTILYTMYGYRIIYNKSQLRIL